MTADQIILFSLLVVVFALLIWGRLRYDVVAFGALIVAYVGGVVPKEEVFSGFGHPATVIIALVLIVSRGLFRSGAIELLARHLVDASRGLRATSPSWRPVAAALSAVMNNVAALALLMPVDMQAAAQGQAQPGADPDAALLRLDPRRHGHPDRHAAQHRHRHLPRGGAG